MKLVLLGDLHYHEVDETVPGLPEARFAFYRTLLERFLDISADMHISLGDLTNFGTPSELNEVYDLLERDDRTFIHVLGNHDLYSQPRTDVLAITGQCRYCAIDMGEARLVFLDTAKEMDTADWGGWLDEEQLDWLEEQVEASGTKPLLVFGHHPVHGTTARSERDKGSIHPIIDIWSILNRKQGVGVYFNGHAHIDSIVAREQWTFVQLSSALDEHGFRIVELSDAELRMTAVDVTDADVVDNAPLLHRHMNHFSPNPEARGQAHDRECVIPLLAPARPQ